MSQLSRRRFAQLLALSSTSALWPKQAFAWPGEDVTDAPLPPVPRSPDERFWREVRSRYLLPRDFAFMNAANLCPSPVRVLETLQRLTRQYEADPSPDFRSRLIAQGREAARRLLAEALRVTPEEIVITRNTTEGNNIVSSGLDLGANDEVIVFSDSHPSNLAAWREKARRFGFSVVTVPHVTPHPGPGYYVDAFAKAVTPRTGVIAFTHITSNAGDLFPAAEICRMARERGVLTLVDGAQTFGALDLDLSAIAPDFYAGSAHKWPCGPKETGMLYVRRDVQDRIWPSIIGVYNGSVGISRKLEGLGQRNDAGYAALAEALRFREGIGRPLVEQRGRELAQALVEELRRIDGVTLWTVPGPQTSAAIVVFRPGTLDPRRLGAALASRERIICTVRAGQDRPGLRIAPHLYNTMDEVERLAAAIRRYMASGV